MCKTINDLKSMYSTMQEDIDSLSYEDLVLKFDEYYSTLVYGLGKKELVNLGENQISVLFNHYRELQDYLLWLREYHGSSNKLVDVVGDATVMLDRILSRNGVDIHEYLNKQTV